MWVDDRAEANARRRPKETFFRQQFFSSVRIFSYIFSHYSFYCHSLLGLPEWPACRREMDTKWMRRPSFFRLLPFLTRRLSACLFFSFLFWFYCLCCWLSYMCLRNASSLARKPLSQCRCVCTFYSIFSLIFYNFIKSSLNGVSRWNGEGVELELESERESRKCLCVFHSTLFLIPTLHSEGEDIPSAFAFGSCVIVGRVSTHFFPSNSSFFSSLSPSCWL